MIIDKFIVHMLDINLNKPMLADFIGKDYSDVDKFLKKLITKCQKHDETMRAKWKYAEEFIQDCCKNIFEDENNFTNASKQIAASKNSLLVREVAKIISKSDSKILIGERRLYEKLREWGWVHNKGTEPKQYALDRGYLEVQEGMITNQSGTFTYYTTKVTGKGQKRILEKLLKEQSEKNKQLKIDIKTQY